MNNNNINDIQIATTDSITVSKVNSATTELNGIDTISHIDQNSALEWSPCSGECPQCGGHNVEINNFLILTSNPPQSQLRCKDCEYYFNSGVLSHNINEEIGDWPPGPQVGDAPWWPSEQESPSYPDITIPNKDSPIGWICPKCGRCYAPHISGCSYCNASEIKITY